MEKVTTKRGRLIIDQHCLKTRELDGQKLSAIDLSVSVLVTSRKEMDYIIESLEIAKLSLRETCLRCGQELRH